MSRVAELAREEAARAEAEDETTDEDETQETGDSPEEEEAAEEGETTDDQAAAEPAQPFANVTEADLKKANRAVEQQRSRLAGILGEAAVAHECLLCGGVGHLPELPPLGTAMTLVEDEGVLGFVFEAPPDQREYPKALDKAPCDWCEAEGMVDTGSKNPHARIVPCTKCNGNGWVTVPVPETPAQLSTLVAAPPPPAGPPAGLDGQVDTWGRPWGHVHFGVPPAAIQG